MNNNLIMSYSNCFCVITIVDCTSFSLMARVLHLLISFNQVLHLFHQCFNCDAENNRDGAEIFSKERNMEMCFLKSIMNLRLIENVDVRSMANIHDAFLKNRFSCRVRN